MLLITHVNTNRMVDGRKLTRTIILCIYKTKKKLYARRNVIKNCKRANHTFQIWYKFDDNN